MQSVRAIQSSNHSYSIATAVVVYLLEPLDPKVDHMAGSIWTLFEKKMKLPLFQMTS